MFQSSILQASNKTIPIPNSKLTFELHSNMYTVICYYMYMYQGHVSMDLRDFLDKISVGFPRSLVSTCGYLNGDPPNILQVKKWVTSIYTSHFSCLIVTSIHTVHIYTWIYWPCNVWGELTNLTGSVLRLVKGTWPRIVSQTLSFTRQKLQGNVTGFQVFSEPWWKNILCKV